jgi:hypothetical protein
MVFNIFVKIKIKCSAMMIKTFCISWIKMHCFLRKAAAVLAKHPTKLTSGKEARKLVILTILQR